MTSEQILAGLCLVLSLFCTWLVFRPPSTSLARRINRKVTALEIEWSETYDKLESLVGRITKRDGIQRKKESIEPDESPVHIQNKNPKTRSELLKFAQEKRRLNG